MIIKLMVEGGDMKPGPAIAQKIGPMGINMGKVISDINLATKSFKGLKVPVNLDVNPKDKSFTVQVSSPPVSGLLKKELGIDLGSGQALKVKVANMSIEQVIAIAMMKHPNMLAKDLRAAIKSVVGTCVSLGILIENKEAKEIEQEINSGKYDSEIKNEKIETSPEKKKELASFFAKLKAKQDEMMKKEQEAKAAEEAAKEAAKAAAGTPGAAAPAAATTAPAKAEEKPKK
jgi:large subunit ribosomal protein L11